MPNSTEPHSHQAHPDDRYGDREKLIRLSIAVERLVDEVERLTAGLQHLSEERLTKFDVEIALIKREMARINDQQTCLNDLAKEMHALTTSVGELNTMKKMVYWTVGAVATQLITVFIGALVWAIGKM